MHLEGRVGETGGTPPSQQPLWLSRVALPFPAMQQQRTSSTKVPLTRTYNLALQRISSEAGDTAATSERKKGDGTGDLDTHHPDGGWPHEHPHSSTHTQTSKQRGRREGKSLLTADFLSLSFRFLWDQAGCSIAEEKWGQQIMSRWMQ